MLWYCAGPALVLCWPCTETVLVLYWCCAGTVMVLYVPVLHRYNMGAARILRWCYAWDAFVFYW